MGSCGEYNWTLHKTWLQLDAQNLVAEGGTMYSRPVALFAATCAVLFFVVGVPGNLLTVVALARSPALRAHATTAFIVSLCASDLIFCLFCLPPTAARFMLSRWPLSELACSIFPFLFYGNVAVSVLSMTAIAVNRYILIMWHSVYARLYTRANILMMVLLVWAAGFSLLVPPLLGTWGCLGLEPFSFSCTILKKDGASPKKLVFVVGFVLPCTVMAAAYSCIYWRVRRSRAALKAHGPSGSRLSLEAVRAAGHAVSSAGGKKLGKGGLGQGLGQGMAPASGGAASGFRRRDDRRLTRLMLTVFCSFLVCFLPLTVVNAADGLMKSSLPTLQLLPSVLAWASAVINPFIYAATNRQYRAAYRRLLSCCCSGAADGHAGGGRAGRAGARVSAVSRSRLAAASAARTSDSGSATATNLTINRVAYVP